MTLLYADLARTITEKIDKGVYASGERLPGVRAVSRSAGVSVSTAVAAYRQLEIEGYLQAKPRSGFYVAPRLNSTLPAVQPTTRPCTPKPVSGQQRVLDLVQRLNQPGITQFGANVPDASYLPTHEISRTMSRVGRLHGPRAAGYEVPPGLPALRHQIAKRMASYGHICSPEDIVITNGCQEALYLSLKATTKPGDVVAVESPTYYGLLQILDALDLKALEIPTDPQDGISLDALSKALTNWPVNACILAPNFSNPIGALMPLHRREQLMALLNEYPHVSVIEDDIYGDLAFTDHRPNTLQSYGGLNQSIYCSSFSKSLSPGLRIGWVAAPNLTKQLEYEKFVTNCATPSANQLVVAHLLKSGKYDRHLKKFRLELGQSMRRLIDRVSTHFPETTKITHPQGGMALWCELAPGARSMELAERAIEQAISIAPGPIFSSSNRFTRCLRLTCAVPWNANVERAIKTLGHLAHEAGARATTPTT